MIGTIILILVGLLLFKLAGGPGTLFAIAMKILGVMMIIGAIGTILAKYRFIKMLRIS